MPWVASGCLGLFAFLGLEQRTRFIMSTSEMFGEVQEIPQRETAPFYPRSPYGAAKVYAYWITVNYQGPTACLLCNGILFNHESPIRGETFVTRKDHPCAGAYSLGFAGLLVSGEPEFPGDWGHARDFVEAQWLMLQADEAEDFVIATGVQHSVREFVTCAAAVGYCDRMGGKWG